jgi:hypothetical protein
MRGKIFNDGKKAYEINIGPKFHDISAVLNGAERSAKALSLFINGDKVAYVGDEGSLEKVASLQESFEQERMEYSAEPYAQEIELFEKKASKIDLMQKVAEIKKEIQGKIIGLANNELMDDKCDAVDNLSKIVKLLYTKYWSREQCEKIANQISQIAETRQIPLEVAFDQFLKVLNFAGIELSPLELNDIYYSLIRVNVPDLRQIKIPMPSDIPSFMDSVDSDCDANAIPGTNVPSIFETIRRNIIPNSNSVIDKISDNPGPRVKAVIIKVRKAVPKINDDVVYNDMMNNVVRDLMPERSVHRKFIIKRFGDIANDRLQPNLDNTVHFAPMKMLMAKHASANELPFLLSGVLHANYENERVAHYDSDDFEYGLSKFASCIEGETMDNILNELIVEKTAKVWGKRKAIFIGIPAIFAYSALQRARIRNGNNVSSANRYVAEVLSALILISSRLPIGVATR